MTAFPVSVGNPQSGTAWTACGRVITRGLAVPALKLGSLFDGIGGFPLIWEQINGKGTCLWASEVESFCIAVTKKRFSHVEENK